MKSLILALALFSASAQADTAVKKDLGTFRNWKAALVSGHALWAQEGCMAYSAATGNKSTIEVYSQKQDNVKEGYSEPTVQIVARKIPEFTRAILKFDDGKEEVHLTLASSQDGKAFGVLSRLDDRASLIGKLKTSTTVSVVFVSAKNKGVKTLSFSTRGFTKAMDTITAKCALPVVE